MAEPAYIFGRVESPGGIQPPPTRLPFVQGIIPLLLALVGGYQLLGLRTTTLEPVSLQGALLVGTLVCGVWGAVRMRRSLRLRAFAKAHRAEPWLWDHPWTQETVAPQLATGPLLRPLLGGLAIVGLLGAFGHLAPEVLGPDTPQKQRLGGGFMMLALTTLGLYVTWRFLLRAFYRRWKARRVFGRYHRRALLHLATAGRGGLLGARGLGRHRAGRDLGSEFPPPGVRHGRHPPLTRTPSMLTPLLLLLTAAPPDAATLRAQAQKAYDAKQFAKACPLFEKLTQLSPQDGAAWADLSLCLFRAKKKPAALDAARHAVRWGDEKTRKSTYFNLDKFGGEDGVFTRDGDDAPCKKAHLPACAETAWLCADPYSDLYRTSGETSGGSYSAVFLCSEPQSSEGGGCTTIDLGGSQDTFAGTSDDSPGIYSFKGCTVVAVDPCERRLGLACTEGEGVLAGPEGRTATRKRAWVEERGYEPLPKPKSPDAEP
ncbi:hypothetical protein VZQ01_38885 [Myxococcus faecalis]|uniref:tetratricopeptide repeat protein n=1 Tax=Myxococcus faecalis TaxID=3115646 RepID=UPI003CF8E344